MCRRFTVNFLPNAIRDLSRLPAGDAARIIAKTNVILTTNPLPQGKTVRRIINVHPPLSRLRVGDWRVFFEIHGNEVRVVAVCRKPKADQTIRHLRT